MIINSMRSEYASYLPFDLLSDIPVELFPCYLLLPESSHVINHLLELLISKMVLQMLGDLLQIRKS